MKRAVEDGGGDEERVKSAFKRVFTALMTADAGRVAACAEAMARDCAERVDARTRRRRRLGVVSSSV